MNTGKWYCNFNAFALGGQPLFRKPFATHFTLLYNHFPDAHNTEKDTMKLSENNKRTLMLAIHQKIEEYADYFAGKLNDGETTDILTYPPDCRLTGNEKEALEKLKNDQDLQSALRKILAGNSAGVIFDLMNYLDGTADPNENLGGWTEVAFVDKTDDVEPSHNMLHDYFYSTYWDWKAIRPNRGWARDTNEAE